MQGRFFRLSLRQNFSLTKHSRTPPHLRSHSSRRSAPTPQCRSFVIRPCPQTQQPHRQPSSLKRVEFASKLQEKIHATNAAEHRENFAARKIQPRPAVSPDMTGCALLKKCTSFKLQNYGCRDGEPAGTLYAQAIPTHSKCRSNGLPTHSPQFRSLLKQKNRKPSPVHGRARQRRARVRANKNQYYIYDVKCAFGDDFFAQKRGKYAF